MDHDLNVKCKTVKLLRKTGEDSQTLEIGKEFLDFTPKALTTKEKN